MSKQRKSHAKAHLLGGLGLRGQLGLRAALLLRRDTADDRGVLGALLLAASLVGCARKR